LSGTYRQYRGHYALPLVDLPATRRAPPEGSAA
jgi:hypothetical protein